MSEAKPEAGMKEVVFDIEDLTVRYHGSPAISRLVRGLQQADHGHHPRTEDYVTGRFG